MRILGLVILLAGLSPLGIAKGVDQNDLKPYPAAKEGFERMVFSVPPVENEVERKVEIIVGKILSVDCNQTWFSGDLDEQVVQGWGYTYFVLEKAGGPASTMMSCPEGQRTDAFVTVRGEGFLQRYNSKLPIVVYVPKGFEVRYRIWQARKEIRRARPQ